MYEIRKYQGEKLHDKRKLFIDDIWTIELALRKFSKELIGKEKIEAEKLAKVFDDLVHGIREDGTYLDID